MWVSCFFAPGEGVFALTGMYVLAAVTENSLLFLPTYSYLRGAHQHNNNHTMTHDDNINNG